MKHNFVFYVVLLLSNQLECSLFYNNLCQGSDAMPMDNFNYTRFLGNWYFYASSSNYDQVGVECIKKNYFSMDNYNIYFEQTLIDSNDTLVRTNETRQLDVELPGVIKRTKEVQLIGVFGNTYSNLVNVDSVVVYTDYTHIQLRYSCTNLNHFWFGDKHQYYFILVRDRNFDSIKLMKPLLVKLKRLGLSLDNMVFYNNQNCVN